ncbi:hypothetical protein BDZ89DRAFT_1154716 [Hymenopellis radicata]|nr:hypothetical protein BDZ89DRAFT_1154716 [Hymenopellis radicata]
MEVEVILAVRGRKNHETPKYLVKWWGWPHSFNTWEPPENFTDMERLLGAVWAQVEEQRKLQESDFTYSTRSVKLDLRWVDQQIVLFHEMFKNRKRQLSQDLTIKVPPLCTVSGHGPMPSNPSDLPVHKMKSTTTRTPIKRSPKVSSSPIEESSNEEEEQSFSNEEEEIEDPVTPTPVGDVPPDPLSPTNAMPDTPLHRHHRPETNVRVGAWRSRPLVKPSAIPGPHGPYFGIAIKERLAESAYATPPPETFMSEDIQNNEGPCTPGTRRYLFGNFASSGSDSSQERHTMNEVPQRAPSPLNTEMQPAEMSPDDLNQDFSWAIHGIDSDEDEDDVGGPTSDPIFDVLWEGDLCLSSENGNGRSVIVTGTRSTSTLFSRIDWGSHLVLERFYPLALVARLIRHDCLDVKALVSLKAPSGESGSLNVVKQYMIRQKMVATKTVSDDQGRLRSMWVFYPPSMKDSLGLEGHNELNATLGGAMLDFGKPVRSPGTQQPIHHVSSATCASKADVRLWNNIGVLGFPDWLHRGLNAIERPVFFMMDAERALRRRMQREFGTLSKILGMYPKIQLATSPSPAKQATIIFIHFSALGKPSGLPLMQLRKRTTHLFIGFGSPPSRELRSPKFAVIFRSGGLITFTPAALCQDPVRVFDILLRLQDRQPGWRVYVPTYILGAAFAKHYQSSQNVLEAFKSGNFVFEFVLISIVESSLELTSGLLRRRSPTYTCDKDVVLQRCMDDYAVFQQQVVPELVNITISKDVLSRQRAIDISATFRRYIVLDAVQTFKCTTGRKEELRNELEWLTCREFVESL